MNESFSIILVNEYDLLDFSYYSAILLMITQMLNGQFGHRVRNSAVVIRVEFSSIFGLLLEIEPRNVTEISGLLFFNTKDQTFV